MRLGMDSLRKVGSAKRVRIEGWRQKRLGSNGRSHREEGENASHHQRRKTCLTLTGPSHGRLEAVISRQIQSPGSKERREFAWSARIRPAFPSTYAPAKPTRAAANRGIPTADPAL